MPGTSLFKSTDDDRSDAPVGLMQLINGLHIEANWEALILRYLDPENDAAALIKHESLEPFWASKLKAIQADTAGIPNEGQLSDSRHPFDILAGKFCAYRGWSSRTIDQGPDHEWLERGVTFSDYMCCDRLCYLTQKIADPLDEDVLKAISYANAAANHHGSIGFGLLAETYFRVGSYFKRLEPEQSMISICFQLAADNMIKAVRLSPFSHIIAEQACCVHSRRTRFCGSASKKMDLSWRRKGATLEETQWAMINTNLAQQTAEDLRLPQQRA